MARERCARKGLPRFRKREETGVKGCPWRVDTPLLGSRGQRNLSGAVAGVNEVLNGELVSGNGAERVSIGTITLCASSSAKAAESRWLAPVLAAWPGSEVPAAERATLEAVVTAVATRHPDLNESPRTLLVVLDGSEDAASVAKIFDLVQGAMLPAVVIAPDAARIGAMIQRHGVIVVDERTDSREIAAMLFALVERQSLVTLLRREVRTGTSADRGIRGEMDRLHEELHLAATVQRELLPQQLPEDEHIEFASLYHPATYVSGDLFDARVIDEHRIGFFIADAVGHGVPAALITMMLSRALLNQFAMMTGGLGTAKVRPTGEISPAACLRGLNLELCQHVSGNYRFATAVCGVLDKRDFSVRLAGAGHPPSLLLHAGAMRSLDSQGPLLGVFAEAEYSDEIITLEPGATLLLYTDGFELAFPAPGVEIKDRRVAPREYLKHMGALDSSMHEGGVRVGMEILARALADQEGSLHQRDDVTALAIRRPAAGAMRKAA